MQFMIMLSCLLNLYILQTQISAVFLKFLLIFNFYYFIQLVIFKIILKCVLNKLNIYSIKIFTPYLIFLMHLISSWDSSSYKKFVSNFTSFFILSHAF